MFRSATDRSRCVILDNGFIARVFRSRIRDSYCFNLLKNGCVVAGNIGFKTKSAAIDNAKEAAERRARRAEAR